MSLNISACKYSDIGGRPHNEDCADHISNASKDLCLVLADGLGGEGSGDVASKEAVRTVKECFAQKKADGPSDLEEWFSKANDNILSLQDQRCRMKTTLVVLQISGDEAIWAHIGDSRLYHFVDGVYKEKTFDHSVSQMAVLRGEIKEEEIRGHVDRNKLLKALGLNDEIRAECSDIRQLNDGSKHAFLLCSDGFWEFVYENEMEDTLKESADAREWLSKMVAILNGRKKADHDNNTAIAVIAE